MFFSFDISVFRYLLMFVGVLLPAQAQAVETLSLQKSVSFALEHNRMLAAAATQVDKAQSQIDIATGQMMPRIDISTGVMRTDSPLQHFGMKLQQQRITAADFAPTVLNNPGYISNYQTRLGLRMPLFAGGALWAAREGADYQAEASALDFEFQKQQLIYQTITAYVQSRQALAQVEARENAVKAAEKRWQDAKALKKRGMSIVSDVMDAHVHVLRTQVALDEARSTYQNSLEHLHLVMGMQSDSDLANLQEPVVNFSKKTLDDLLLGAEERRSDLLALEHRLRASDMAQEQSRAAYLPQVDLVASQEWNSDTLGIKNRDTMVGLTVRMNVFAGGGDRARLRAAEFDRSSLSFQLADKRQQIRNEIKQAWRSLNTADKRLRSEAEALKQTSESLRIKSLRHAQGLEKTSDLLDAQVRADASRVAYIRATYDFMIAKAALLLAAGSLNEEVVQ